MTRLAYALHLFTNIPLFAGIVWIVFPAGISDFDMANHFLRDRCWITVQHSSCFFERFLLIEALFNIVSFVNSQIFKFRHKNTLKLDSAIFNRFVDSNFAARLVQ